MGGLYLRQKVHREKITDLKADLSGDSQLERGERKTVMRSLASKEG